MIAASVYGEENSPVAQWWYEHVIGLLTNKPPAAAARLAARLEGSEQVFARTQGAAAQGTRRSRTPPRRAASAAWSSKPERVELDEACLNWNRGLGACASASMGPGSDCPHKRQHKCSVCGKWHRAKDFHQSAPQPENSQQTKAGGGRRRGPRGAQKGRS